MTRTNHSGSEELSSFCADLNIWIERCREEIIADLSEAPASEVLRRFFAGGKMLRARVVLAAASAAGGNPATALPVAEAIELLHGASLVHDDIIDQSTERRGVPTIHVQLGTQLALTIGDYLLLRTFAVLLRANSKIGPELTLRALEAFSNEGQKCCRGEFTELSGTIDSKAAYLAMVRRKTGSLFALAGTMGALVGGGCEKEIEALRVFGDEFGTAFQICDDALDLFAENCSLRNSIWRLLLKAAEDKESSAASSEGRTVIDLLREHPDIFDAVIVVQERHVAAAREALRMLRPSQARESLETLVQEYRTSLAMQLRRAHAEFGNPSRTDLRSSC
jgi:geranylgeranyl pyrophosphate synthase